MTHKVVSHVGERFGKDGQLEVVEDIPKVKYKNRECVVLCHSCKLDAELHGDGKFTIAYSHLKGGRTRCGCSSNPRWTQEQYAVRIKRRCDELGYEYLPDGNDVSCYSKIPLACNKCGNQWNTTALNSFMHNNYGCPVCGEARRVEGSLADEAAAVRDIMKAGQLPATITLSRDRVDTHKGHRRAWKVHCKICAIDKYSHLDEVAGVFRGVSDSLRLGHLPCRCSKQHERSNEQIEVDIAERIAGTNLTFVRWHAPHHGRRSRFVLYCEDHGDFTVTDFRNFMLPGPKCPSCTTKGFQKQEPAQLYVLRVAGSDREGSFTGYGITGKIDNRLRVHRRNLSIAGYKVEKVELFSSDGETISQLERQILNKFCRVNIEVEGFKRESTLYSEFDNVLNFCNSWLKIGENQNAKLLQQPQQSASKQAS